MEIFAIALIAVVYTFCVYYAGYRKGESDTNIRRNNADPIQNEWEDL